jgi:LmbE family N-acetylglucosaminyl deacetylase
MSRISRRQWIASGGVTVASLAGAVSSISAEDQPGKLPQPAERKFKIVVTGGHPGDPEYGCGGTIARLTAAGHAVSLLYLNHGDPSEKSGDGREHPRIAEATHACEILKAKPMFAGQIDAHAVVDAAHYEAFREQLAAEKPDAVFTHWPIDNHADHRAMFMLVFEAWKRLNKSFALFYYEVSNGEDTLQFSPTEYVDISETEPLKRRACFAHASQSPERYYKLQEIVASMRGAESGHRYAEGFVRNVQGPNFPLSAI